MASSIYTNLVKKKWNVIAIFLAMVYQIDCLFKEYTKEKDYLYTASLSHIKREEEKILEKEKIKQLLLKKYHDFVPLFKKAIADVLPPHWPYDYKIILKEEFMPPFGPI